MSRRYILNDIPMSSLGFGCYGLCGAYGAKLKEAEMIFILQRAYALGILFYDTANKYGNTETVLGKAVKGYRDKISISSKVGFTDWNRCNLSRQHVIEACETSLKNLRTDYLDLYHIHFDDPNTPISETLEALESLKKEGKIRHYGIGHLPINKTLEYLKLGNVSTVLSEMSAVSTSHYKEIHSLQSTYDFGIIAFSITGRGLLTNKVNKSTQFNSGDLRSIDPLFKRERFTSGLRTMEKLREVGDRYNKTPVQVAISWVLEQPGVIAALTGPCNLNHLNENSEAMYWKLDQSIKKELDLFIEGEEKKLKEITYKEICSILDTPLNKDFERTSNDLIYVMEHAIENKLLSEEDVVPIYLKLLQMKKAHEESLEGLEKMRIKLNMLLKRINQ